MTEEERNKWEADQQAFIRNRPLLSQTQSNEPVLEELSAKDLRRMKNMPDVPVLHAIRGKTTTNNHIITNPEAIRSGDVEINLSHMEDTMNLSSESDKELQVVYSDDNISEEMRKFIYHSFPIHGGV